MPDVSLGAGASGDRTVLAWTQPVLPPLPPGEAQRGEAFEMYGSPAKHPPHTAPGFQAAWQLGLLPPPAPQIAPQRLPGLSANDMLWGAIGIFFGAFAVLMVLPDAISDAIFPFVIIPAGCTSFWLFFRTSTREEQEFAAGYTSRANFTGLWRLGRDGSVLREPDRTVPPPGFYPSPYQPGLLQKWEGPGWKPFAQKWRQRPWHWFRWPERPYLDGVPNRPTQR